MYVARHMTIDPVTVSPDTLITEARAILNSHHFRHLPITDSRGILLGMVTDRDIRSAYPSSVASEEDRRRILGRVATTSVRSIMSRNLTYLSLQSTLDDALIQLERNKIGALPVVDQNQVIKGIFSIRDLMRAYRDLFGLGEKGSALVAIRDYGEPGLLVRIVKVLEQKNIAFTRLIRTSSPEQGPDQAVVYVRVQTLNLAAVHAAFKEAGLEFVTP